MVNQLIWEWTEAFILNQNFVQKSERFNWIVKSSRYGPLAGLELVYTTKQVCASQEIVEYNTDAPDIDTMIKAWLKSFWSNDLDRATRGLSQTLLLKAARYSIICDLNFKFSFCKVT